MTTAKIYHFPYLPMPVYQYVRPNGHTVITIQKPGRVANISTWIRTGSIHENDENNGVSHFLEHLMFKGTRRLKTGEFDRILEARGAIINAATWKDYTYYYVTIPQGDNAENLKLAVDLHADMLLNAQLPEAEIGQPFDLADTAELDKRERGVVIEEIAMREDMPWSRTYNTLNRLMYEQHPYRRDVIGTREIIARIPARAIMDYYRHWYTPANMVTILVSSLEPAAALDIINQYFVFPETSPAAEPQAFDPDPLPLAPRIVHTTGEIQSGFLIMGFHGPRPSNVAHSMAIEVISIILGEGRSSRLYSHLVENAPNPLFHTIGCDHYQFRDGNIILIEGNYKAEKREEALAQLQAELTALREEPILEQELTKAKKKLKARFAENTETAAELAESVGYTMILSNDLATYTQYLENLQRLSLADLNACIDRYFRFENACIATMSPKSAGECEGEEQ
jgi:zinc protease